MQSHFSWKDQNTNYDQLLQELDINQKNIKQSSYMIELQQGLVPVYEITEDNLTDINLQEDLYNSFHNMTGCLIIRNVFDKETMEQYNQWCQDWLKNNELDVNGTHPKQKDKYLINDVIGRLSKENPELFMKLLNNQVLTSSLDTLLGFMKFGSATCHWIQSGGDRQLSHVDYPIHIGSGKFWENSVDKCKRLMTRKQINDIMKFYSCQIIIASDAMDVSNGSTEAVVGSHLLNDMDINIHDKTFYDIMEKLFINVSLNVGDIFIFNRALCHRGGKNLSSNRRNSLIMQCVYLWGIGQEIIDHDGLLENIKNSPAFNKMDEKEKEEFLLRFKFVYPLNVKDKA
jgi:hypothetical protein